MFRTAWFLESTATQILVIFLIRTQSVWSASLAHPILIMTSIGALAISLAIVMTPIGHSFEFVSLPATVFVAIAVLVIGYLASAEIAKRYGNATVRKGA
jgi:Mg2+-importing ATPase